jgi:hypothetical protein
MIVDRAASPAFVHRSPDGANDRGLHRRYSIPPVPRTTIVLPDQAGSRSATLATCNDDKQDIETGHDDRRFRLSEETPEVGRPFVMNVDDSWQPRSRDHNEQEMTKIRRNFRRSTTDLMNRQIQSVGNIQVFFENFMQ